MSDQRTLSKPRSGNVRDQSREASDDIRRFIQNGIADSQFQPGDKLPTERELAVRFRAGRNTVRKTLVALEEEGRIIRQVGRGTFIQPQEPMAPDHSVELQGGKGYPLLPVAGSGLASPFDLVELRCAWEPSSAALAVRRATGAEIDRMQGFIDKSLTVDSIQEFEDLDDGLHRAIAVATRNPLFVAIAEMITTVRNEAEWGMLKKQTVTDGLRKIVVQEHSAIVDAIRRRQADTAFAAMTDHLRNVKREMFGA